MVRMLAWPGLLVLGLVSGCVATDAVPEGAVVDEVLKPPATPHGCVQISRPRVEYWSEFPPEPGEPAPRDYYKTCTTQPDCSSICEGVDVDPSVYSWHLVVKCTKCT